MGPTSTSLPQFQTNPICAPSDVYASPSWNPVVHQFSVQEFQGYCMNSGAEAGVAAINPTMGEFSRGAQERYRAGVAKLVSGLARVDHHQRQTDDMFCVKFSFSSCTDVVYALLVFLLAVRVVGNGFQSFPLSLSATVVPFPSRQPFPSFDMPLWQSCTWDAWWSSSSFLRSMRCPKTWLTTLNKKVRLPATPRIQ